LANDLGGDSWPNKGKRKIRSFLLRSRGPLLCLLMFGSVPPLQAQSEDRPGRKLLQADKPEYPKLLKILAIGGVVRLNVRILPNGTVAQVTVLGGNPVLAESGVKTVLTWKYAPAATATNETVILNFKSH
jgi:TonB family protein